MVVERENLPSGEQKSEIKKPKLEVVSQGPSDQSEPVAPMNIDRGTVRESRVTLVKENGGYLGQAEVGKAIVQKTVFEPREADLEPGESKEQAFAEKINESETPAEEAREIKQEIQKEHIEAAVELFCLEYYKRSGAAVYEAKTITLGERGTQNRTADLTGEVSHRTEFQYVISRSGKKQMKDLLSSDLPGFITRDGYRFDLDPTKGDLLGDRGFTVTLNITDQFGNERPIDINFFYGDDGTSEDESEDESKIVNLSERRDQKREDADHDQALAA